MKILGYSERGVMNALFYGMAFNDDVKGMQKFLTKAGIEGEFSEFELYMEWSLSDFGNPDLIITAKDGNKEQVIIFVEAKVSSQQYYNYKKEKEKYDKYIGKKKYDSNMSSNLFFQLKEKFELFEKRNDVGLSNGEGLPKDKTSLNSKNGKNRKIGTSGVVLAMMKRIKDSNKAHYIAIIPEQNEELNQPEDFKIHIVYWEDLKDDYSKYLKETIDFNKGEVKSQILNILK